MATTPLPRARHEYLLREVELRGSVRAAQAAVHLGVAEVTVRRDIVELDRAGLVARVHGGAIAPAEPRPQAARLVIGVVVPTSAAHFSLVVRGMESTAPALHVRLVLAVSSYRPDAERKQVERLLALGVDGLVLAPTLRAGADREVGEWVAGLPVPAVILERRVEDTTRLGSFDCARTDHAHGAVLAVEHLAALGHRRVAIACYDRTPTAPAVRDGHRRACASLGLGPAPDLSLPKGEDDAEQLEVALTALIDRCGATGTRAVLVHTDDHAARLVEAAIDRGVRVPDDLAIVAYDDDLAELAAVPLTAVTPPRRALGRQALRMLVERVADPVDVGAVRHVQLVPRLTVRESCGYRATS